MFYKKLNQEDFEELKKRTELINSYKLVANALEVQMRVHLNGILPKYHCDLNKNYTIDNKTGRIKEIKTPPPQQPPRQLTPQLTGK